MRLEHYALQNVFKLRNYSSGWKEPSFPISSPIIHAKHLRENADSIIYWILPSRNHKLRRQTKRSYTLPAGRPIHMAFFLGKVTAFSAMWHGCVWSGWQGNIQAGILEMRGLFLSQVTGHMSRNTFFPPPTPHSYSIYVNSFHFVISPPIWHEKQS